MFIGINKNMKKKQQQLQKVVEKVIEGFIFSFIEDYYNLNNTNRTKEACHQYVKCKAENGKQAFVGLLTKDFSEAEVKSFNTIENNWLASIETLKDFEQFLKKTNKQI